MPSPLMQWISATRPKTLPAGAVPVVVASALAYHAEAFNPLRALLCLLVALSIQIGTNFANDLFDHLKGADTPDRIGPTRLTATGQVSTSAMAWATAAALSVALICGILLSIHGGWIILALGIVSIALALGYTAGPVPLAYVGLGDIFVLVFFGLIATIATYWLQTSQISPVVVAYGFALGALSTAILAVNNLRDVDTDAKAGKKTLGVRFGKQFLRIEYALCIAAAYAMVVLVHRAFGAPAWVYLSFVSLATVVVPLQLVFNPASGPALNKALALTGATLILYGATTALAWIL